LVLALHGGALDLYLRAAVLREIGLAAPSKIISPRRHEGHGVVASKDSSP
jgi:hypothetical protein